VPVLIALDLRLQDLIGAFVPSLASLL